MKEKLKVMVVDDNKEFTDMLSKYIDIQEDMEIVSKMYSGKETAQKIKELKPDLLLLDIIMPEKDGIVVLNEIAELEIEKKPNIIVLSSIGQEKITQKAISLGTMYYIIKPFDFEILIERIRELTINSENILMENDSPTYIFSKNKVENIYKKDSLENKVTEFIQSIGVPAHIKGYKYLREAILVAVKDDEAIEAITKFLYPTLADTFKTTPSRIERAIRHAIEVAWNRGNASVHQKIFGYTVNSNKGKPTNSEFIAMITDKITVEERQLLNKAV